MGIEFFNPWMLLGLGGLSLPVLAHLLSRRRYDVVDWGAMQFLTLRREARRRLRLEELLLLLLRMALIALLALAMSRPLVHGGPAQWFATPPAADSVLILDGSYSTRWQGRGPSPRDAAIDWCRDWLRLRTAEDHVALLDARTEVRAPVPDWTSDRSHILQALDDLPAPRGSAAWNDAILRGLKIAATSPRSSRHVLLITDGQALPWRQVDEHFRLQITEIQRLASVPTELWIVPIGDAQQRRTNNAVISLDVSREVTVRDFPVRIRADVKNTGAADSQMLDVFLEVDGQRLAGRTQRVRLDADSQTSVEFEYRFSTAGSHLVTVRLGDDGLPVDNRLDAVVTVTDALPVLLLDGAPHADPSRSESFFARTALSASGSLTPWVRLRVLPPDRFQPESLGDARVVVLANVERLTDEQLDRLKEFVDDGGGLVITSGDRMVADWYNRRMFDGGQGLLPVSLDGPRSARDELSAASSAAAAGSARPTTGDSDDAVRVDPDSLKEAWLDRFRTSGDGGFLDARFSRWMRSGDDAPASVDAADAGSAETGSAETGSRDVASPETGRREAAAVEAASQTSPRAAPTQVAVRLTTGDPLLLTRRFGRGRVALLTSSLDADWTTLPGQPDYVVFLHELLFHLAAGTESRNLSPGTPILFPVPRSGSASEYVVIMPDGSPVTPVDAGSELRPALRLDDTTEPGIYRLRRTDASGKPPAGSRPSNPGRTHPGEQQRRPQPATAAGGASDAVGFPPQGNGLSRDEQLFVVRPDRSESDLTPLSESQWQALTQDELFRRLSDISDFGSAVRETAPPVEIWPVLMLLFLIVLVAEVLLTRHLVQGGHFVDSEEAASPT